ncbi:hypothetical protein As57867_017919, partial [Aphanomyces stellatus]
MESSCAKCGSSIAATDQFCIYCGTAVDRSSTPAPVMTTPAAPVPVAADNNLKPPSSAPVAVSAPAVAAPPKSAPTTRGVFDTMARKSKTQHDDRRDSVDGFNADESKIADLQKLWVPDDFSDDCMDCAKTFGFPQPRRHHCRVCGKLFCRDCVANKCTIPSSFGYGDKPQRCCKSCTISLQMKAINTPADVFSQRQQLTTRGAPTPKAAPMSGPAAIHAPLPSARNNNAAAAFRGAAAAVVATNRIKSATEAS